MLGLLRRLRDLENHAYNQQEKIQALKESQKLLEAKVDFIYSNPPIYEVGMRVEVGAMEYSIISTVAKLDQNDRWYWDYKALNILTAKEINL
jgi:predicted ribosome quality control (RQC) complex YloA/Tae2 family protein